MGFFNKNKKQREAAISEDVAKKQPMMIGDFNTEEKAFSYQDICNLFSEWEQMPEVIAYRKVLKQEPRIKGGQPQILLGIGYHYWSIHFLDFIYNRIRIAQKVQNMTKDIDLNKNTDEQPTDTAGEPESAEPATASEDSPAA